MEPWNTNINANILLHAIHYYTYDCKIYVRRHTEHKPERPFHIYSKIQTTN